MKRIICILLSVIICGTMFSGCKAETKMVSAEMNRCYEAVAAVQAACNMYKSTPLYSSMKEYTLNEIKKTVGNADDEVFTKAVLDQIFPFDFDTSKETMAQLNMKFGEVRKSGDNYEVDILIEYNDGRLPSREGVAYLFFDEPQEVGGGAADRKELMEFWGETVYYSFIKLKRIELK